MPTYEYRCDECGYVFEEFQSMNDEPLTTCPKCKGSVQRLIGPGAGLIFKGSGFYLTDYKKSNSSPATTNPAHATPKKSEPATSETKSDKPSTTSKPS